MSGDAWITLAVVAGVLLVMVRELAPPSAAMAGGMVLVMVTGVVTPEQALSGFSNPAPITVAALYVLARAVEKTGALTPLVRLVLGEGANDRTSLARLAVPTAASSAFLNNTPIVAMLLPQVVTWAEENEKSPSLFLMPLSFAALLGGVVTVIGTSTNIVISGLLEGAGEEPLGFFELASVGLPIAVGGVILLVALTPLLLKQRRPPSKDLEEARSFFVDMTVDTGGALDGRPVEAGGLRHLKSLFLATIDRDGDLIAPVAPETVLHGGDRLRFVGRAGSVVDLQSTRGLSSAETPHMSDLDPTKARMFEVVIGPQSQLNGMTLKDAGFRARYQAVVMAIHRAGQRVDAKLGQVRLRVGDTMLVMADPGFRDRWRDRSDFLMISSDSPTMPVRTGRAWIVGMVAAGIVVAATTGALPILEASLLGAIVLVGTRVLTPGEARNAVDLDVVLLIAAAFGLAAAMATSGLAETISEGLVASFGGWGARGVLLGIVLATVLLTGLISNNAAALLMFPIAASASAAAGMGLRGAAVAVTVAASVDFLTPIGYQTNTMVYGPGGYRFFDYARLGAPLTAMVVILLLLVVPGVWP